MFSFFAVRRHWRSQSHRFRRVHSRFSPTPRQSYDRATSNRTGEADIRAAPGGDFVSLPPFTRLPPSPSSTTPEGSEDYAVALVQQRRPPSVPTPVSFTLSLSIHGLATASAIPHTSSEAVSVSRDPCSGASAPRAVRPPPHVGSRAVEWP